MFFIAWHKCNITGLDGLPLTVAVNFAFTCMEEYFVLPIMRMLRRIATGGNLKNPHAKIVRAVVLADNNASRDALCLVIIEMSCLDVGIRNNLHALTPLSFRLIADEGASSEKAASERRARPGAPVCSK